MPQRAPDMSGKAVQNLLLSLGGLLLVVAAIVFTAVSWGSLGIGARTAILLGFTALTLAAPLGLLKRGLTTTAETVALLGFALLLLDGYAAWQLGFAGLDRIEATLYTGLMIAVMSGLFALYGMFVHVTAGEQVRTLRSPVPVAIGFAQLPLPLISLEHDVLWFEAALLTLAVGNTLLWNRGGFRTAAVFFWITWSGATILGAALTVDRYPAQVFTAAGLLLGAVAVALFQVSRGRPAIPLTAGAAMGAVAALAFPSWAFIANEWRVTTVPLAALVVGAAAQLIGRGADERRRRIGRIAALSAGAFGLLAAVPVQLPVSIALLGPLDRGSLIWSGPRAGGAQQQLDSFLAAMSPSVLVVLATVALGLAGVALLTTAATARKIATVAATVAAAAVTAVMFAVLPVVFNLPFGVTVGVHVAITVALAAGAVRLPVLAALALAMIAEVAAWALISQPATLIAAGVLTVTAAALAWRVPAVRTGAAGVATALAGGEAVAVWLAADQDPRYVTFVLLAVAALAAVAAWLLPAAAIGVEVAGSALILIGFAYVVDQRMLSVALALAGVIAVGTALRPDRRAAGYAGTALLLLASWTRMSAENVTVVEAYTVPVSVVLLAFGWWRARTESSWVSYGSGLSFSLLPSLWALYFADQSWVRALVLGLVSLLVLLAGAKWRLQAPALLGGGVLAGVAAHELAPWISELVLSVPRWVPVAFGGLLLLVLGATYEARLREVRRLGAVIKALR